MNFSRRDRKDPDNDEPEIRVTDRRRIYLDDEGNAGTKANSEDTPNLKPSYVEELEARTRAAEKQVHDVQARFEQVRSELQRETDATRQRLNRAADERAEREKANFIAAPSTPWVSSSIRNCMRRLKQRPSMPTMRVRSSQNTPGDIRCETSCCVRHASKSGVLPENRILPVNLKSRAQQLSAR